MAFFAPLVDENPVCITEEVRFAVDSPARGQDSKPPLLLSERQCRRMRDRSHAERLTTAVQAPCVETPPAGAERRDVKKSAHHRHVL